MRGARLPVRWTRALERARRIPGRVRRRRFRLYGVGDGKTGTTSLGLMFRDHYRSAHEADAERMLPVSTSVLMGSASAHDVRAALHRRSWRLNLEVDAANFLSPFAGRLAQMYDDARFVLTIRDCYSWLDSRIEWIVRTDLPDIWRQNFDARYGRYRDHPRPEEEALQAAGLRPIASYLRYWSELPERVIRDVPQERLCIVRTEDLDRSCDRLATFVGAASSTIVPAHVNRNEERTGLLASVPIQVIDDLALEHCGPLMQRFWGDDWMRLRERLPQR